LQAFLFLATRTQKPALGGTRKAAAEKRIWWEHQDNRGKKCRR
jgi:hypothetical protein